MFRSKTWQKGHYIDNHRKYECRDCEKQFIVGEKLIEDCPPGFPCCPYCGQSNVECIVWTDDEELELLADEMGCLAIYYEEE